MTRPRPVDPSVIPADDHALPYRIVSGNVRPGEWPVWLDLMDGQRHLGEAHSSGCTPPGYPYRPVFRAHLFEWTTNAPHPVNPAQFWVYETDGRLYASDAWRKAQG